VATTLQSVGFQLIGGRAQVDLDRAGFERAIREFGTALANASVALFYYAGHGVQLQGVNYLVPVAANPETAADVDFQLINANTVLKLLESPDSGLNIVILDACRNNPFGGRGLRDAGGGLAQMQAPRGTLISYATQPGNVAMDGATGHSPYTAALAEAIRKPGIPILEVFNQIGLAVDRATAGRQQPWVAISPLEGAFYFVGPVTVNIAPPSPAPETVFWQTIATSNNAADFEEYLRQFPQGQFAGLAHNRLAALRAPPAPSAPAAPAPANKNQGGRFDGIWTGTFGCDAFKEKPAVSYPLILEVRNNQVSKLGSCTEDPGEPGYDHYEGTISPDGHVFITRHAVGLGYEPGAMARGEVTRAPFDGVFSSENFIATERSSHGCSIQLTRRR
jgi:hypothetical protein